MTQPLILTTLRAPGGDVHAIVTPEDEIVRAFGWGDPAQNIARLPGALRGRGVTSGDGSVVVREAVEAYGDGDLRALDRIPAEQEGGPFFHDAWRALRAVAPGETVTYSELAELAGRPQAVRAAASACARNLVALIIPCHRVVRRDGGLGGFAYGLPVKRELLAHEARFADEIADAPAGR